MHTELGRIFNRFANCCSSGRVGGVVQGINISASNPVQLKLTGGYWKILQGNHQKWKTDAAKAELTPNWRCRMTNTFHSRVPKRPSVHPRCRNDYLSSSQHEWQSIVYVCSSPPSGRRRGRFRQ